MIKITFKNVGQGDSIILEWQDKGKNKVGIIDCNKHDSVNPILDHVKSSGVKHISFLLLTHPHTDHCSGFTELIEYCIENKLTVDYFIHTSNNMPAFWKAAVDSKSAENELLKLFKILRSAKKEIKLQYFAVQGQTLVSEISLDSVYKMKVLAPTSTELDKYADRYDKSFVEEELGNNPSANWLATLLRIGTKDWYVLLTSDISKTVLVYYDKKHPEELVGEMILAQSPHHGSARNHNNTFWSKRKVARKRIPIVFSAGRNSYGHPSKDAVSFFYKNGFDVYSTNEIGALTIKPATTLSKSASSHLAPFGSLVTLKRDRLNGDKIFEIDTAGNITAL